MNYVLTDWKQFEKDCDAFERDGILRSASYAKKFVRPSWDSHMIYHHNKKDFIVKITDDSTITIGCLCTEIKWLGYDEIEPKIPFKGY